MANYYYVGEYTTNVRMALRLSWFDWQIRAGFFGEVSWKAD
jgi:hypothetical protein